MWRFNEEMWYALYIVCFFLSEPGPSHEILNKPELIDILGLKSDDFIAAQSESTPLLIDIVERIKHNKSINAGFTSTSC